MKIDRQTLNILVWSITLLELQFCFVGQLNEQNIPASFQGGWVIGSCIEHGDHNSSAIGGIVVFDRETILFVHTQFENPFDLIRCKSITVDPTNDSVVVCTQLECGSEDLSNIKLTIADRWHGKENESPAGQIIRLEMRDIRLFADRPSDAIVLLHRLNGDETIRRLRREILLSNNTDNPIFQKSKKWILDYVERLGRGKNLTVEKQ